MRLRILSSAIGTYINKNIKTLQLYYQLCICYFIAVGHGRSEGARAIIHDFQHYVDDAIQFVDIIKSEYPDVPVFVMGHSMVKYNAMCSALV